MLAGTAAADPEHPAGPGQPGAGGHGQTDGADTGHGDLLADGQAGTAHGPHGHGQRLGEGEPPQVGVVGHGHDPVGRGGHLLGGAAGPVDAEQAQVGTGVGRPPRHGRQVPQGSSGSTTTLVPAASPAAPVYRRPEMSWPSTMSRLGPGVLAGADVQVGAAQAAVGDLDQDLAVAGPGPGGAPRR